MLYKRTVRSNSMPRGCCALLSHFYGQLQLNAAEWHAVAARSSFVLPGFYNCNFTFLDLNNLSEAEITAACKNIASFYEHDIDEKELTAECDFAKFF